MFYFLFRKNLKKFLQLRGVKKYLGKKIFKDGSK
jgi:hypothetical protein